jgi:hypothetical protein
MEWAGELAAVILNVSVHSRRLRNPGLRCHADASPIADLLAKAGPRQRWRLVLTPANVDTLSFRIVTADGFFSRSVQSV